MAHYTKPLMALTAIFCLATHDSGYATDTIKLDEGHCGRETEIRYIIAQYSIDPQGKHNVTEFMRGPKYRNRLGVCVSGKREVWRAKGNPKDNVVVSPFQTDPNIYQWIPTLDTGRFCTLTVDGYYVDLDCERITPLKPLDLSKK